MGGSWPGQWRRGRAVTVGDSAGSPAIPRAQKAGECGSEFPTLSRQGRSESPPFAGLWAGLPGLAKAGVPATRCESPT